MKKVFIFIMFLLLLIVAIGCSKSTNQSLFHVDRLVGDAPPEMILHREHYPIEIELGSYCWTITDRVENKTKCIDKIVPGEDAPYITVLPREMMQIKTDYA